MLYRAVTFYCKPFQAFPGALVSEADIPSTSPHHLNHDSQSHWSGKAKGSQCSVQAEPACLFIRHYWGNRCCLLFLHIMICLSSMGHSLCVRSVGCALNVWQTPVWVRHCRCEQLSAVSDRSILRVALTKPVTLEAVGTFSVVTIKEGLWCWLCMTDSCMYLLG